MGTLSAEAVAALGFARVGKNVRLSDRASFYNCSAIAIGDDVRVDDFCVFSAGVGGISIGHHVHIAAYTSLIGAGAIVISEFCNLSSRVSVYSSSDDYSGRFMTNPTVPAELTNVDSRPVRLEKHVIVGCGSVILPGVVLEEGVAIGALSLVRESCAEYGIYAGNPARRLKARCRDLLKLEAKLMAPE